MLPSGGFAYVRYNFKLRGQLRPSRVPLLPFLLLFFVFPRLFFLHLQRQPLLIFSASRGGAMNAGGH
ncbi:hypothetical protein MUK42_34568 [Musa troglodytarum]|uniref:Uncharacterized protein n=1 Tax=Musa troglodytarum TaxID=320322 RepID=A0A9E7GK00_9LILI|nr:hypothetical protein MUK42_34568 [Musa troglodytarum]